MCWSTVEAPEPSGEETAIYNEILNLINQQQAYNQMMMPQIAHQQHYKIVEGEGTPYEYTDSEKELVADYEILTENSDEAALVYQDILKKYGSMGIGDTVSSSSAYKKLNAQYQAIQKKVESYEGVTSKEWVKMTDEEWYNDPDTTDQERAEWDAYVQSVERYNKALAGELPLSNTLQQQKAAEFEQLKSAFPTIQGDSLENATGTDTIGIQNLSEFKKRWATVEEAERTGTLTSGAQQAIQTSGLITGMASQNLSNIANTSNLYGGNIGAYQSVLQPMQAYNMAGYQAAAQNQAIAMQGWGSLLGLGGMLGGGYLASSRKFKKNITQKTKKEEDKALEDIKKTKSYTYEYKDEIREKIGMPGRKYLGAIAEESPDEITMKEKNGIFIPDKLELVSMGIKSLARKIEKLEKEKEVA